MKEHLYNARQPACGQKIFPISAIEVIKTEDINYNVWRELYITDICSNLVLNLISPSFPAAIGWFYIRNSNAILYDNAAMVQRYANSKIADKIISELLSIDKHNYVKNIKDFGPIDGRFGHLSELIHEDMVYADSELRMSNVSLCMLMEYVGRTLQDIPKIILAKDMMQDYSYELDKPFSTLRIFEKILFEYIYALFCINSKSNLIHGDLHMNNVTIYQLHRKLIEKVNVEDKRHVVYLIRDKCYIFPHIGLFAAIIDFSRGIIGDYGRIEHEFSPLYAEKYFSDQYMRVIDIISYHLPELFLAQSSIIKNITRSNFPLIFKILTLVDTITLSKNMQTLFTSEEYMTIGIGEGIMPMIISVETLATTMLISYMKGAISGKYTNATDIEWPNYTIISTIFASHLYSGSRLREEIANMDIVDIFNENNPIAYDVSDYDQWGPILSTEQEEEYRRKNKLKPDPVYTKWKNIVRIDETENLKAIYDEYLTKDVDIVEYEPWMLL
jgi:hypothetical protein